MLEPQLLSDAVRYLGDWLDYRLRTLQIPGLVAAVAVDGHLVLHRAYGLANVETSTPMSVDMAFPVASHSKMFTAALVLRLVEQGRLQLDDRVGRWVPELSGAAGEQLVGELMSHSAGVTRDGPDADFWQLQRDFPTTETLLGGAESVLGRNERFKYSNVGFGLLGRVVEAVYGDSYDTVVRHELINVLGLHDTSTDPAGRACPVGYTARRGGVARRPLSLPPSGALAPATGFCSTAADLCTFADSLCDGDDRLLTADRRRLMRHVVWPGENGDQDYCLGLNHTKLGERRVHGHGGAYPGFITSTRFEATSRLIVVVLTNAIDAPAQELTLTMLALIDHAQKCGSGPPGKSDATGRYSGIWGTLDIVRLGSQLMALDPDLSDPLERRTELTPDGLNGWIITRSSGYGSPGERVTFASDSCRFGGMTLRREVAW